LVLMLANQASEGFYSKLSPVPGRYRSRF